MDLLAWVKDKESTHDQSNQDKSIKSEEKTIQEVDEGSDIMKQLLKMMSEAEQMQRSQAAEAPELPGLDELPDLDSL